jgi:uncharacterized protein (TIGR00269 family)
MRQHKLALCKEHYIQWVLEQTERNIQKYRLFSKEDTLLVAVSGGKDSLALWDVLNRLGYKTGGLYINLGIGGEADYSNFSQQYASDFAGQRSLELYIADIKNMYGSAIPEISSLSKRDRSKPCAVCGLVKRHTMNVIANRYDYDVLVTGHNLDDEVAVLFNNTLSWQVDLLRRQSPLLHSKVGLQRKAKPFCRFYERETAAYAILSGIEYIEEECPFATGSTTIHNKNLLNQLEHEHAGTKLSFYLKFLKAKKTLFPDLQDDLTPRDSLFTCPVCGQPSPKQEKCAFCRLMEEVRAKKLQN